LASGIVGGDYRGVRMDQFFSRTPTEKADGGSRIIDTPGMNQTSPNPKRTRRRWRAAGIVGSFLALNWYLVAATDVIRPSERTQAAMAVLEQRVRLAADQKLEIPDDLNDLPSIAGRASDANDAWGRPILLERTGDEVTLVSYGKDGRPGGAGLNGDLVHRFALKD